jgi:hypothetical protein
VKSQAAQVERFVNFRCGLAEKRIQTGTATTFGDDRFPMFVLLTERQDKE